MSEAESVDAASQTQRQSRRFLLLYALAVAGGATAYVPFLTILLPVRVETIAGDESITWLAYAAFAGAIAASVANIGFGWLSDITRNRRGWILAGLALSSSLLVLLTRADSLPLLIAMLVMWQLGLNMMLSPLSAWAGDVVPDHQKGTLGGLLAFAPAAGALSGALITIPGLAEADTRMALVAGLVAACVLPVVIFGRPKHFPELMEPKLKSETEDIERSPTFNLRPDIPRGIVARMWLARLLVQIAEAALFAYLYLWLRSISPEIGDNQAAQVFGIVLLVAVPVTLLVGRWADKTDRPILPLGAAAGISAAALLVMGLAPGLTAALLGYAAFGLAAGVFLALHTAQTLRVLPRPQSRGRDLGLFNLTNTMPSLIMPGLTLALVPYFGFQGLFVMLAILALGACLLLLTGIRQK